jgi:hypothetical protein
MRRNNDNKLSKYMIKHGTKGWKSSKNNVGPRTIWKNNHGPIITLEGKDLALHNHKTSS